MVAGSIKALTRGAVCSRARARARVRPRVAERRDPPHDRNRRSHQETFMANEEHVALLKQGVDAWNAWRRENPNVSPDLSRANLAEADLSKEKLLRADLSEVNLLGVNLRGADLFRADLFRASLLRSDLSKANLCGANL